MAMLHRAALLPFSLAAAVAAAGILASGCSGGTCTDCGTGGEGGASEGGGGASSSSSSSSTSGTTSTACQSTQGTIEGTVYRFEGPGSPEGQISTSATIVILSAPDATPLYGKADLTGHYSIPLDAGQWYIGAEDETNCETDEPVQIQLDPCETEVLDLVLDICFDG